MTLIERKTRFQFVRLIDGRDADSVNHTMRAIVKDHGDIIKTITADNGSEFADLSNVLDGVADVYYAHPYRSSERGTNEAHKRMLRRDFPQRYVAGCCNPTGRGRGGAQDQRPPTAHPEVPDSHRMIYCRICSGPAQGRQGGSRRLAHQLPR